MKETLGTTFQDSETGDDVCVIVRAGPGVVAIFVALIGGANIEMALSPGDVERLVHGLQRARRIAECLEA